MSGRFHSVPGSVDGGLVEDATSCMAFSGPKFILQYRVTAVQRQAPFSRQTLYLRQPPELAGFAVDAPSKQTWHMSCTPCTYARTTKPCFKRGDGMKQSRDRSRKRRDTFKHHAGDQDNKSTAEIESAPSLNLHHPHVFLTQTRKLRQKGRCWNEGNEINVTHWF